MKKGKIFSLILISLFWLTACKKDAPAPVNQPIDTTGQTLDTKGTFKSSAHTTTGNAKVYTKDQIRTLAFETFKTDNGPDLRVYLAKNTSASEFVELGGLKSTSGDFTYTIPSNVNLTEFKYVLIWCKQFSVLFGYAELQ